LSGQNETDQGVQFTSRSFTENLESAGVKISMDGRGRVFDNIFIERLWRTVKYEDIYLKNYTTVMELNSGLDQYFRFYNNERFHQSLFILSRQRLQDANSGLL
jgi:putative transposase